MSDSESNGIYIKLTSIEIENRHDTVRPTALFSGVKPGAMVKVRPCGKEYEGKTFLGMYLCSAPTGFIGEQQGEKIVLKMTEHTNPAIYVPKLDKIIWGYASWWGEIESEDQLKQITDQDIDDVWYVKALRQLDQSAEESKDESEG